MKKLTLIALLCLNVFGSNYRFHPGFNATLEREEKRNASDTTLDFFFELPELELNEGPDGFSEVNSAGLDPQSDFGAPALVSIGEIVALPIGITPHVTTLEEEKTEIENILIRPSQERFRCHVNGRSFSFNQALYDSKTLFPKNNVSTEKLGVLHGIALWRIAVQPVQMNFKNKSLLVTHRLRLKVTTSGTARLVRELPKSILNLIESVSKTDFTKQISASTNRLLVVTADSLKETILPLVQVKQDKGFTVTVKTFGELGGTKEKTLAFIKSFYKRNRGSFSHLLMVGDKNTNPGFMESTSSGNAASDMRYALLEGNDYVPDVLYGRLLASSVQEAKTQVDKWIAHEKAPESGNFWSYATTIASSEGSSPSDVQYAQQIGGYLKKGNYTKVDEFFQGKGTATPQNIKEALNEGRSWLSYIGHGSGTSWGSTNGSFSNSNIAQLTNTRLPAIIDVACDNASWVNETTPFGKAWMVQEANGKPAGALTYYGGSVSISWDPPAVMSVGISKAYGENKITSIGALVIAGQLHLQKQIGAKKNAIDNLKWYNLFGDPTLDLRTVSP